MKKTIRKQKAEKVNDVGRLRTTWRVNGNSADLILLYFTNILARFVIFFILARCVIFFYYLLGRFVIYFFFW
jgi:hypothetical protein